MLYIFLFIFIVCAAIPYIAFDWPMALSMIFGAVVTGGCFALLMKITSIQESKEQQKEQAKKKEQEHLALLEQLNTQTWDFPINHFKLDCERQGIQRPLSEESIRKAQDIVIGILKTYEVPASYHSYYSSREKINDYFERIDDLERGLVVSLLKQECSRHGITSISSEASYQKVRLIMENVLKTANIAPDRYSYHLDRSQIEYYFAVMTDRIQKENEKQRQDRINQLKDEEKAFSDQCLSELQFIGKEKTIQHCNSQVAFYRAQIKACKDALDGKARNAAGKSMQYDQVDNNWAVHGGVASAIAGPVAGAVIAADAKRSIDKLNQQNAELERMNISLFMLQAQEIKAEQAKAERRLREWEAKLEAAKYALEEWQDENFLLRKMKPVVRDCTVTETGAVRLTIGISQTPDLLVFNEKPAFVDGSILVQLKHNGKIYGTAICCLPFKGSSFNRTVECICTQTTDPDMKYQVHFAPNKLWAMEKI